MPVRAFSRGSFHRNQLREERHTLSVSTPGAGVPTCNRQIGENHHNSYTLSSLLSTCPVLTEHPWTLAATASRHFWYYSFPIRRDWTLKPRAKINPAPLCGSSQWFGLSPERVTDTVTWAHFGWNFSKSHHDLGDWIHSHCRGNTFVICISFHQKVCNN